MTSWKQLKDAHSLAAVALYERLKCHLSELSGMVHLLIVWDWEIRNLVTNLKQLEMVHSFAVAGLGRIAIPLKDNMFPLHPTLQRCNSLVPVMF
jgi:hypothetical protein